MIKDVLKLLGAAVLVGVVIAGIALLSGFLTLWGLSAVLS